MVKYIVNIMDGDLNSPKSPKRKTLERQSSLGTHTEISPERCSVNQESVLQTADYQRVPDTANAIDESVWDHNTHSAACLPQPVILCGRESPESALQQLSALSEMVPMSNVGRKRKHPMKPGKHICKYCGKACAKPSVLEKHIRMHTGERPYPCDICGLSFKTKSNLYKHRKSNTHTAKLKEKGLSQDSTHDESFNSSFKNESMDYDGDGSADEDNQSNHASFSRSGSFGSVNSIDIHRKPDHSLSQSVDSTVTTTTCTSHVMTIPVKDRETYIEALRQLEAADDCVDKCAAEVTLTSKKCSYAVVERSVVVTMLLLKTARNPKAETESNDKNLPLIPATVDLITTPASTTSPSKTKSLERDGSRDEIARIDKLLKDNTEIVGTHVVEAPRRRLSRQNSVSSPANSMFTSALSIQLSNNSSFGRLATLPESRTMCSPVINVQILEKRLKQAIKSALPSSHDSDGSLVLVKKVVSDENSAEIVLQLPPISDYLITPETLASGDRTTTLPVGQARTPSTCQSCHSVFAREYIQDIHLQYYCPQQVKPRVDKVDVKRANYDYPKQTMKKPPAAHSFDDLPIADDRKRLCLMKVDSEHTYYIADSMEAIEQKQLVRSKSELPPTGKGSMGSQSSTDVGPLDGGINVGSLDSGVNTKQYLKNHLMKNRSQASLGTDLSKQDSQVLEESGGKLQKQSHSTDRAVDTKLLAVPPTGTQVGDSHLTINVLATSTSSVIPSNSRPIMLAVAAANPSYGSQGSFEKPRQSTAQPNLQPRIDKHSAEPGDITAMQGSSRPINKPTSPGPSKKSLSNGALSPAIQRPPSSNASRLRGRLISQTRTESSDDNFIVPTKNATERHELPTLHSLTSQTSFNGKMAHSVLDKGGPTINMRVGTAITQPLLPTSVESLIQTSKPQLLATSNHPITFMLYGSQSMQQQQSGSSQPNNAKPEGINFDCRLHYCTLHSCRATHTIARPRFSNYSMWTPSKPPITLDFPFSMSKYNSCSRSYGQAYTFSQKYNRSILTHSSYWKYKNKIRFMHDMSSQNSISEERVNSPSRSINNTISSETAPFIQQNSSTTSTAVTIVVNTVSESKPTVVNSDNLAKKFLHRSQSTPSGDLKSKGVAGGFKSNEDYVYVRGRGKGQYVCKQCGIRCKKPSMLKKHIRTHTDLRPYSCKHCKFSFKTKGNLTKHMRSKAHHRRCHELKIFPVPSTVDESQIDKEILASQQRLSRESKIQGKDAGTSGDEGDDDGLEYEEPHTSEEDDDDDDDDDNDDSSVEGTLQIDENANDGCDNSTLSIPVLPTTVAASLRRAKSMPSHRMANSFDEALSESNQPPPKKKKRNHLDLSLPMTSKSSVTSKLEDDAAMSLLCLSATPVNSLPPAVNQLNHPSNPVPDKINDLIGALQAGHPNDQTNICNTPDAIYRSSDVKRVSVVRSTKTPHSSVESQNNMEDSNEPMDLRVPAKSHKDLTFVCLLCRAICASQESLDEHMKNHTPSTSEPSNSALPLKYRKKKSSFMSLSLDDATPQISPKVQTPGQLKRQHAFNVWGESDCEDDIDPPAKSEPGEELTDELKARTCHYCLQVLPSIDDLPLHVKTQHPIANEYICTYKECGKKFNNKQELTYHLGTHALDDSKEFQPITITKCGVCEKPFKSITSLKQHLQQHTEVRSHICEYCDAGFTTAQSLKHHLKTHTQERPYICGECGCTFARSDHLQQHSKTHKKNSSSLKESSVVPSAILTPSSSTQCRI